MHSFSFASYASAFVHAVSQEKRPSVPGAEPTFNGSSFSCAFVLSADGTYAEATYKDGSLSSTESGTYEVKSNKVILHENGNMGTSTVYKYKGGKLVNNGHEFTKE